MSTLYHIYCDETCSDKGHNYMVLAGIMAEVGSAKVYRDELLRWRRERRMYNELKWTRVSANKILEYTDFVETAIDKIKRGEIVFQAMVLDKTQIDYNKHQKGDKELGFYKFFFQLLYHRFCKRLSRDDQVVVFPDERYTKYDFDSLRNKLNSKLGRERDMFDCPVRRVKPVDSKTSQLMQVNDLLMGAIGFHSNRREELPGSCLAKIQVAAAFAKGMGLQSLRGEQTRCMGRFGIWQFKLQ